MFGQGGGKAVKKPQNQQMGTAVLFVMHQGYGNIPYMYVLPERTGYLSYFNRYTEVYTLYNAYKYTVENMFINFDGLCFI